MAGFYVFLISNKTVAKPNEPGFEETSLNLACFTKSRSFQRAGMAHVFGNQTLNVMAVILRLRGSEQ